MLLWGLIVLLMVISTVSAGTVLVDKATRNRYFSQALVWNPSATDGVSTQDLYNGPPNPYNFRTFQTYTCDYVEPDPADPVGGTTPKFHCEFTLSDGSKKIFKVKYDQQYNSLLQWGRGNEEVYANVISQRVLWALGFGSDQSIPVTIHCRNCPIEPWTYTQVVQGYDNEDVMSGWMDMRLVKSGEYKKKVPVLTLTSAIIALKYDEFVKGDAIEYTDANNATQTGFGWKELYTFPINDHTQTVARNALSMIAAFLSHVDNFDGNQGLICLDETPSLSAGKTKSSCKGTPFAYIHDIGGSLGYGWKLSHKNFWPNYMDLKQWLEATTWGNLGACEVMVNGIPGCSWHGSIPISEEGRELAARLLLSLTDKQISDLFTVARANLMRGDSIEDWIAGFHSKLDRDVKNSQCGL